MAKALDGTEDSGRESEKHNVEHRKEMISNALEQLYQEDKQIKALIAEHVQAHRDEKRDIKKRLREDLNLPAKVINARYSAYRMERAAIEAGDEITMDTIREMYEVAPVGQTMDLVEAIGKAVE